MSIAGLAYDLCSWPLLVSVIVVGMSIAGRIIVGMSNEFRRIQDRIAILENRIAVLERSVNYLERWDRFLRELWNSSRNDRPTFYAILHPNNMVDSYETSGTAAAARDGIVNVYFLCYRPDTGVIFFRPTVLSESLSG